MGLSIFLFFFCFTHTELNSFKYFYLIQIILLIIYSTLIICLHRVEWFQVLLCITNISIKHWSFVYTQLNEPTVLFLTIQFSISHLFALSYICPIDRTLSCAITPAQSEHGSNVKEEVLCILQNFWNLTISLFSVISRTLR